MEKVSDNVLERATYTHTYVYGACRQRYASWSPADTHLSEMLPQLLKVP